ncbi:hypothetical protein GCM10010272_16910 [Streptomyces lateritius]|nr:hypothetical protein GCM10010272_16910 [Streptomyces lateritius]
MLHHTSRRGPASSPSAIPHAAFAPAATRDESSETREPSKDVVPVSGAGSAGMNRASPISAADANSAKGVTNYFRSSLIETHETRDMG